MFSIKFRTISRCALFLPRKISPNGFSLTHFIRNESRDVSGRASDARIANIDVTTKFNALDKVTEDNIDIINHISPSLKKSFNLAAYVNASDTLQQLVKLNVDLSKIDKHVDLASYLVRADFKTDIEPYILFLLNNGVSISDVGEICNRNPFFLTEPIDDLQTRVNYFLFRKFSQQDVATIITRASNIFSLNTKIIDSRLGNLVKEYRLSAVELRHLICKYPRLIALTQMQTKKCTFMFNEEMGFSQDEIKSILMKFPIMWRKFYKFSGHRDYVRTFDYLHNEMAISHELIVKCPQIFSRRLSLIKPRHLYLKILNRAQYDPTKPLYVPLSAFYEIDDSMFCLRYTKTSVNDFNAFLKTI